MRIHRLELQAFGPFAGRETVDFTVLNEAGLFLLDGPTGSGKSTVLSAICFALYGTVPGGRTPDSVASTHASVGTRPEVLVDVTLGGRRFEVLRWPRYRRPKQRRSKDGSLYTEEKAGAQLREQVEGEWKEISVRADEIGQLLTTVLPLDSTQFMHVIMLPQGEFARFLRADSKEKEALLRQIFGTDRFDHVERHLATRHQSLADAVHQDELTTERLRSDMTQVLDERLGPEWSQVDGEDRHESANLGEEPSLPTELTDLALADRAEQAVDDAIAHSEVQRAGAAEHLQSARSRHEALAVQRRQISAAQGWAERERDHRAARDTVAHSRVVLEAHRSAIPVAQRAQDADLAIGAEQEARREQEAAVQAALADEHCRQWDDAGRDADPVEGEDARFRSLLAHADRALEALDGHRQDATQLTDLERHADQAPAEAERLAARIREAQETSTGIQSEIQTLEQSLRSFGAEAAALERSAEAVTGARARATAAHEVTRLQTVLDDRQDQWRTARDQAADARERHQDLIQQRLDNAAGLLAAALQEGHPCPVCGSSEHPAPVSLLQDQESSVDLSAEALERARAAADRAVAARDSAQERLNEVRVSLEESRLAAGGCTLEQAEQGLERAVADHERASQAATALEAATARRHDLDEQSAQAQQAVADAHSAQVEFRTRCEQREAEREKLADRLAAALRGRPTLEALRQELVTARGLAERADQASGRLALARARADHERQALDRDLAASEHRSVEAVRAALLEPDEEQRIVAAVRDWDSEQAALAELARSSDVQDGQRLLADGIDVPSDDDQAAAHQELTQAEQRHQAAVSASGALEVLRSQVAGQVQGLRAAHERSAEQRRQATEALDLLQLVRGGGENEYRMRLASYVLTGRLEDVAQAATERLLTMTDGRYELIHDDSVTGARRRGLDLVVKDLYTDTVRPASTLSGGETFMASLALALGLADTVQAEAGGVEMDTLFIDEGFGSLDAETLDQVMEVLGGLQDGGRTLGLVSHVERMRQEIGYRLQVTKTRHGSHLQVVLPTGEQDYAGQHAS